jgi:hypothetical protein
VGLGRVESCRVVFESKSEDEHACVTAWEWTDRAATCIIVLSGSDDFMRN